MTENMCSKLLQADYPYKKKGVAGNTQVTTLIPLIQSLFASGLKYNTRSCEFWRSGESTRFP